MKVTHARIVAGKWLEFELKTWRSRWRSGGKKRRDEKKGRDAERRFVSIARSLSSDFGRIKGTRLAGSQLDNAGVDVIIYLQPLDGGPDVKVPFQIKSSTWKATEFRFTHPECFEAGVPVFVVNDERSDADIALHLIALLDDVLEYSVNFDGFIEKIKKEQRSRRSGRTEAHQNDM